MDQEYDITPAIQEYFTERNLTTKTLNIEDNSTVFDILEKTGYYSKTHNTGLNLARMKNALYEIPKNSKNS